MINQVRNSYIDNYKKQLLNRAVKSKPAEKKQVEKKTENQVLQKGFTKKDVRKRWGITAGVGAVLSTIGLFAIKGVREALAIQKVALGIPLGISLGTGLHFLFTKKSKLKHDGLENNYGKRLSIISALGAITALSITVKNFVVDGAFKTNAKLKGRAVIAGLGVVTSAISYSLFEGIKGIADRSLKKEQKRKVSRK